MIPLTAMTASTNCDSNTSNGKAFISTPRWAATAPYLCSRKGVTQTKHPAFTLVMASSSNTATTATEESNTEATTMTQSCLTDSYHTSDQSDDTEAPPTSEQADEFSIPSSIDLSTFLMSPAELEAAMTLPYDHSADLITDPPSDTPQFTGTIDYQTLDILTAHLRSVADESRVAITPEGWYISVMDPANVVQLSVWLPATDWREYHCEREGVLGLSWAGPGGTVKSALDHSERGATIEISHTDDRTITFDDGIPLEFGTIDPDSIRSAPEPPDLALPNSVTLPGVDLAELTKRMNDVTDHVMIRGHPQTDSVDFVAEGDTAIVRKEYEDYEDLTAYDGRRKHTLFETFICNADQSLFSLEYLRSYISAPPKRDLKTGYTCRFGDEFPLRIDRELGDDGFLRFCQAPRRLSA
jgi:proliferating cell nuclear antigen